MRALDEDLSTTISSERGKRSEASCKDRLLDLPSGLVCCRNRGSEIWSMLQRTTGARLIEGQRWQSELWRELSIALNFCQVSVVLSKPSLCRAEMRDFVDVAPTIGEIRFGRQATTPLG